MARNILVEALADTPVEQHQVEIVERKGRGHPDSICDAIMERVSVALCRAYLKEFGVILHHNIDKGLLVAGQSEKRFGGGRVTEPMKLIFGDRATFVFGGKRIPVSDIAVETAKKWFKENLRFVDPDEHLRYQVELRQGSEELSDIFARGGRVLGANDTSAAVGYAPLTETERLVLECEKFLNSRDFMRHHPESGEDIKVMGFRKKRVLHLTVAMAFVDKSVKNEDDYFKKKDEILGETQEFVESRAKKLDAVKVYLNTLDVRGRGLGGVYLTVTGTSAEDADCGEVGRGNKANGVIALNRPASAEAAAGKNPVSHVGKIYSLLAHKIAGEIYAQVPGVQEVYVWLCSQIGSPIDEPKVAACQLILDKRDKFESVSKQVHDVIDGELANIGAFTKELALGKRSVC